MKRFLVSSLLLLGLSSPALAVGPYSRQVNSIRASAPSGAEMYSRNVTAIRGASGYPYNYHPSANLGSFAPYGYGAGGFITPGGYMPWSSYSTPWNTQFYGGMMGPGFYQPYSFSAPNYYGFGVY